MTAEQTGQTQRKFIYPQSDFISCDVNCDGQFSRPVEKQVKGVATVISQRCIAPYAALRGQHHALPQGHEQSLSACRVCVLRTKVNI
jgi:hypothetical protein